MSAAIPHQLVPVLALKPLLSDDTVLAAMTVTGFDGTPRAIQKDSNGQVYYQEVAQEDETKGPWVVIGAPVFHDSAARKHPNGQNRIAADYVVPVWLHAYDIEPDNLDLNKMLRQIISLLEGKRIAVDGGEAFTITVYTDASPQRINKGTYIFTAIGVKFLVAAQVT